MAESKPLCSGSSYPEKCRVSSSSLRNVTSVMASRAKAFDPSGLSKGELVKSLICIRSTPPGCAASRENCLLLKPAVTGRHSALEVQVSASKIAGKGVSLNAGEHFSFGLWKRKIIGYRLTCAKSTAICFDTLIIRGVSSRFLLIRVPLSMPP